MDRFARYRGLKSSERSVAFYPLETGGKVAFATKSHERRINPMNNFNRVSKITPRHS